MTDLNGKPSMEKVDNIFKWRMAGVIAAAALAIGLLFAVAFSAAADEVGPPPEDVSITAPAPEASEVEAVEEPGYWEQLKSKINSLFEDDDEAEVEEPDASDSGDVAEVAQVSIDELKTRLARMENSVLSLEEEVNTLKQEKELLMKENDTVKANAEEYYNHSLKLANERNDIIKSVNSICEQWKDYDLSYKNPISGPLLATRNIM